MTTNTFRLAGTAVFGVSGFAGSWGAIVTPWGMALMPALTSLSLVVWALSLHCALLILNRGTKPFRGTLRVVCYAATPDLLGAIPFAGEIVGLAWKMYLTVIGVMTLHRVSALKAVSAITAPILFAALLALLVGLLGIAAALYR
jgi:hypothetical protein